MPEVTAGISLGQTAKHRFTSALRSSRISKQYIHHCLRRRRAAGMEIIMKERFNDQDAMELYEAILSLENPKECEAFLQDLCTINELISMTQRYQVAKMLDKEMTYSDIARETSASTTTISRVNRALNYGANGYRTVIDRMKAKNNTKQR